MLYMAVAAHLICFFCQYMEHRRLVKLNQKDEEDEGVPMEAQEEEEEEKKDMEEEGKEEEEKV